MGSMQLGAHTEELGATSKKQFCSAHAVFDDVDNKQEQRVRGATV